MSATLKAALLAFCAFAALALGPAQAQPRQFKVASASLGFDQRTGEPLVSFRLTTESARGFGRLTEQNVGRKLDIRVDGKTLMQPVVREPIIGGSGQLIVPSVEEGHALAARLSGGTAVLQMDVIRD